MLAQSCLLRRPCIASAIDSYITTPLTPSATIPIRRCRPWLARGFRVSARLSANGGGMQDHYATLDLPVTASAGEIKKQFYKLSKANHPDLHPNDPTASSRFVAISEAYNILGSATKKQTYDRDFLRASQQASGPGAPRSGSYSSASTPAGGRPASGLSRRRTQFKGPPPSFYQSGGWGSQGEKRSQHAYQNNEQGGTGNAQGAPGVGPGGFAMGAEHDVPHFDQRGHQQTHETLDQRKRRARQRVQRSEDDLDYSGSSSPLFNFILVSGALAIIFGVSSLIMSSGKPKKKDKEKDEG